MALAGVEQPAAADPAALIIPAREVQSG